MTCGNRLPKKRALETLWQRHDSDWRSPSGIVNQSPNAPSVDPDLLRFRATDAWWGILEATQATLFVTREYEHLVIAMTVFEHEPLISYLSLPHPSGIAADLEKKTIYIASTRNPNMVYDFAPVSGDRKSQSAHYGQTHGQLASSPLLPKRIRFYPGRLYIHDLSIVARKLHANSVGQNAVIVLHDEGGWDRVWWPRCIEQQGKPIFDRNHIQLNSIAAGPTISESFFSASAEKISARRPGHANFPVDRRGVIFSGQTREPIARGLTRPHSARLHQGQVYVDDSGYGELVKLDGSKIVTVARLPGWTRGLSFHQNVAFIGSSRVIPRFQQYAPGLDLAKSRCGVHAVDLRNGQVLASCVWPFGNQIFGIELVPNTITSGFPMRLGGRGHSLRERRLFYSFDFER